MFVGLCNTITTTTTMNETLYNTVQRGLYSDCLDPETDLFFTAKKTDEGACRTVTTKTSF